MSHFQSELNKVTRGRLIDGLMVEIRDRVPDPLYGADLRSAVKTAVLDAELNSGSPVLWKFGSHFTIEIEFISSQGWRWDFKDSKTKRASESNQQS